MSGKKTAGFDDLSESTGRRIGFATHAAGQILDFSGFEIDAQLVAIFHVRSYVIEKRDEMTNLPYKFWDNGG